MTFNYFTYTLHIVHIFQYSQVFGLEWKQNSPQNRDHLSTSCFSLIWSLPHRKLCQHAHPIHHPPWILRKADICYLYTDLGDRMSACEIVNRIFSESETANWVKNIQSSNWVLNHLEFLNTIIHFQYKLTCRLAEWNIISTESISSNFIACLFISVGR